MEYVPLQFAVTDISVGQQCHLVLYTDRQLQLLQCAHCRYVDGTFYVMQCPFVQLWSIHAFVRVYDAVKQVPLMSRRRCVNNKAVLKVKISVNCFAKNLTLYK